MFLRNTFGACLLPGAGGSNMLSLVHIIHNMSTNLLSLDNIVHINMSTNSQLVHLRCQQILESKNSWVTNYAANVTKVVNHPSMDAKVDPDLSCPYRFRRTSAQVHPKTT